MAVSPPSAPAQTVVKRVIRAGDSKAGRPRLGATGEIEIVLNSITGPGNTSIGQIPADVQRSKYFSTESKSCEFEIGTGSTAVDRAFEKHLQNILSEERCNLVFVVLLEETFNNRDKEDVKTVSIKLDCDVNMIDLLNSEPIYKWYPETKLEKAKQAYSQGVERFKEGRYLDSFHLFQYGYRLSVLGVGQCVDRTDPCVAAEAEKLNLNCCNNLAACHFQWGNHQSVIDLCSKVIERDPGVVKALYRRGVSYLNLKEFDLSERDLVAAHKKFPTNRAVNEKLGQAKQRRKAGQAEMKKTFYEIFSDGKV